MPCVGLTSPRLEELYLYRPESREDTGMDRMGHQEEEDSGSDGGMPMCWSDCNSPGSEAAPTTGDGAPAQRKTAPSAANHEAKQTSMSLVVRLSTMYSLASHQPTADVRSMDCAPRTISSIYM